MRATYRLLQARASGDPVRAEEHASFARKMGVPLSSVTTFDLLQGDADYEAVTRGVDGVLVGGSGEFGVLDDVFWMQPFLVTMRDLAQHGFPTFASCFGFQAMALALGGTVETDPDWAEVGSYDLSLCPQGKEDPLFGALPDSFVAQEGHKDSVKRLPRGCTLLASSERCPHQALRVDGTLVYATQFHPELTDGEQRERFGRYFELYKSIFGEERARAILDEMRPSIESNALLASFHALVCQHKAAD